MGDRGRPSSETMPARAPSPRNDGVAKSRSSRLLRWAAAHPVLAVLAVAGFAAAAISVSYTTASTLATSVTPPPIQFVLGDDTGSLSDYVTAMSISTNKTYLTSTVKGVPEATLTVGSFFKITNVDDASHVVTLSTANVTNSLVSAYTLEIYNSGNALQDTLDLREATATPDAQVTIGAGATYYAKLTLTLASTAGANNVDLTNSLTLSFT